MKVCASHTSPGSAGTVDLTQLAGIWVERWLAKGGGLVADLDAARLSISMRDGKWRSKRGHAHQRQWHDGWTVGRWRELWELIYEVPGLYAAVVDHVAQHGEPWGSSGRAMHFREEVEPEPFAA